MSINPYNRPLEVEELEGISDQEMRKALVPNIWEDDRFAVFLEIELVDHAYDMLKSMIEWTAEEVRKFPKGSAARTDLVAKHTRMALRCAQLRDEIKRLNMEEAESAEAKYGRVSKFAFELTEALERLGEMDVLSRIKIDEDCTAAEFMANYRAKRERKAVAA